MSAHDQLYIRINLCFFSSVLALKMSDWYFVMCKRPLDREYKVLEIIYVKK